MALWHREKTGGRLLINSGNRKVESGQTSCPARRARQVDLLRRTQVKYHEND